MKKWTLLKKEFLAEPELALEYERLKPRYELISQLIDARLKKGLTQRELADKIGAHQSAIARLESGQSNPTIDFLGRIASATGAVLTINLVSQTSSE